MIATKTPVAAPYDFQCLDIYPPGTLPTSRMQAYKQLDQVQRIQIRFPIRVISGRIVIEYQAQVPQDWMRDEIKARTAKIEADEQLMALCQISF